MKFVNSFGPPDIDTKEIFITYKNEPEEVRLAIALPF